MLNLEPAFLGLTLIFALWPAYASAEVRSDYILFADNNPIGTVSLLYNSHPDGGYSLTQVSHIETSDLFDTLNIHGALTENHDSTGRLIRATLKENDSNSTFWIHITLLNSEYAAFRSEITSDQQKASREEDSLVESVAAQFIPGLGDIMALGKILQPDDSKMSGVKRFAANSFDSSFIALPQLWLKSGYTLPSELRIFDRVKVSY